MKLLSFLILVLGPQETEIEKIVSKISEAYKSKTDVEMAFTQKKFVSMMRKPLVSSGTAYWKAKRALFRTTRPHKSETLMTGEDLFIWIPESGKIERFNRKQAPILETVDIGVGMNAKDLLKNYKASLEEKNPRFEKEEGAILLRLKPVHKDIKKHIREMWKWVRRKDHLVYRVEILDKTGDRTVTEFDLDKIKVDQGLTDKDVSLSAPKNTKVVEPLKPGK